MLIAVLVAGAIGYWGYDQYRDRQQLEIYLGNKYQQAFYELVERVEQLQVLLGKTMVSSSPRQNILILTDVWNHATTAQEQLNRLPLSNQAAFRAAKFLNQTGDYAHVLAQKNAEGKVLTAENRKKLVELRQQAARVSASLHDLESQVFSGDINWVELVKGTRGKMQENKPNPMLDGFDEIRSELSKYPTLIYDGPFSDHITETKPRGLQGNEVTKTEARRKAEKVADFVNNDGINVSRGKTVNGRIRSYNFQVKNDDGEVYSVDISRKGGHLVNMLTSRQVAGAKIGQKEAAEKARDYLARIGYPNMEPTYSEINDNIAFISFAYKPDNIIYYTDIINVQVALDNGQILGVEALNYLMSHREREKQEPEISEEEVRGMVNDTLEKIENIRLAVIPEESLKEVFTYEVRGTIGEETYLVYINAKTGVEEQILKVIKGKQGTFAL
ncbi:germination protein YpeB [Halothermothrix orenii]|uniref:Spore germination YpeB n=1 Tax=Halothermothrix orenii (strain H 168 / OCM 544 / DSM 9562) TaxID=373903 RepID=B8D1J1_HALOH|nr:germination protein YpeB [Halothermothrix orenii]ACL69068.1 Spore germination YpeB [Halothermothrix orenii H 168]